MKIYGIVMLLAWRVDRVFTAVFQDKMPDKVPTIREWGWRDLIVTTVARYSFEGVDYDDYPKKFQFHDCQEQMERCTLMIPYASRICSFVPHSKIYWNLYSPCQMDYLNCNIRANPLKWGISMWGRPERLDDTPMKYEGQGFWCGNSRRLLLISEDDIEFESDSTPDYMTTAMPTPSGVHLNI